MICITVARNSLINSYINLTDGTQIYGQESLKMLGFVFGRRPTAAAHVDHVRIKFFGSLWTIRHLIKAGLPKEDLMQVYCTYVRPVIEYCSNVYHCLLSEDLSNDLENLQRVAIGLIYGRKISYSKALEESKTERLDKRRRANFEKFARKLETNHRFAEKWLIHNGDKGVALRNVEKYKIIKSNYDRLRDGPLNRIRLYLNSINE